MIRATVLDLGSVTIDREMMLAMHVVATRKNPAPVHEFVSIPVWSVLIETEEHKILYDLGCRPDAMEGGWPEWVQDQMPLTYTEEQTLPAQLAKAGLRPEDIDTVIVSHLHQDHFGNIGLFQHADVYVPKEDWINALIQTRSTIENISAYDRECVDVLVKQMHPVSIDEDFELFPGIDIITLPGHAENLLGLMIHLEKDGTLLFPSDTVYSPENYGPPVKVPGLCFDNRALIRSVEKVRHLVRKNDAALMYSHTFSEFRNYKKLPEWYT